MYRREPEGAQYVPAADLDQLQSRLPTTARPVALDAMATQMLLQANDSIMNIVNAPSALKPAPSDARRPATYTFPSATASAETMQPQVLPTPLPSYLPRAMEVRYQEISDRLLLQQRQHALQVLEVSLREKRAEHMRADRERMRDAIALSQQIALTASMQPQQSQTSLYPGGGTPGPMPTTQQPTSFPPYVLSLANAMHLYKTSDDASRLRFAHLEAVLATLSHPNCPSLGASLAALLTTIISGNDIEQVYRMKHGQMVPPRDADLLMLHIAKQYSTREEILQKLREEAAKPNSPLYSAEAHIQAILSGEQGSLHRVMEEAARSRGAPNADPVLLHARYRVAARLRGTLLVQEEDFKTEDQQTIEEYVWFRLRCYQPQAWTSEVMQMTAMEAQQASSTDISSLLAMVWMTALCVPARNRLRLVYVTCLRGGFLQLAAAVLHLMIVSAISQPNQQDEPTDSEQLEECIWMHVSPYSGLDPGIGVLYLSLIPHSQTRVSSLARWLSRYPAVLATTLVSPQATSSQDGLTSASSQQGAASTVSGVALWVPQNELVRVVERAANLLSRTHMQGVDEAVEMVIRAAALKYVHSQQGEQERVEALRLAAKLWMAAADEALDAWSRSGVAAGAATAYGGTVARLTRLLELYVSYWQVKQGRAPTANARQTDVLASVMNEVLASEREEADWMACCLFFVRYGDITVVRDVVPGNVQHASQLRTFVVRLPVVLQRALGHVYAAIVRSDAVTDELRRMVQSLAAEMAPNMPWKGFF